MAHESPDWSPATSTNVDCKEEIKEEIHDKTVPSAKADLSTIPEATEKEAAKKDEIKKEEIKPEDDSPFNPAFLCPPVRSPPEPSGIPVKAPPVSQASYRNLSTRTTSQPPPKPHTTRISKQSHSTSAAATAPPPSTTSSTSSEDPIIVTTNVPIPPKAQPDRPPLPTARPISRASASHDTSPQATSNPYLILQSHDSIRVNIPRPQHNGHRLPFNFSSDIKQHLQRTHLSRQPLLVWQTLHEPITSPTHDPIPIPSRGHPSTRGITVATSTRDLTAATSSTTTLFPPVPPIPDTPLTDQQAATLEEAILRIARQAAAAAAAHMNQR